MNTEQTFKNYLQAELLRRCKGNPKYSLRSFARALDTEPSFLSKILNGKRAITRATVEKFGARLGLNGEALKLFLGDSPHSGAQAEKESFVALTPDRFQLISEWHHYAILELLRLPDFELSPRSVARALGIPVIEAKFAIKRLRDHGFLPEIRDGVATTAPANHTTFSGIDTAAAYRAFQRQVLELALRALDDIPVEERDQSSMTMAVDRKLLPEVRTKIRHFRRGLDQFLQSNGTHDSVYHLSISLYPVSRTSTLKKKVNKK